MATRKKAAAKAKAKTKAKAKRRTPAARKAVPKRKAAPKKKAATRKAAAKRKAAPRARPKSRSRAKTKAGVKTKSRAKTKSQAKTKSRAKAKAPAWPKRKAAPKARVKAKAKTTAKTRTRTGAGRKAAPKAKAKSAPKRAASARPKKAALRPARSGAKTIVLFPEAAFGPALNCVGIAQRLKQMGHNPVFVCDKGFTGVFEKYGFEEHPVDMSGGMSDEEIAKFWANFIAGHLPHFHLSPIEQIPTYVVPVWEAIVDSAIIAEDGLDAHLSRIKPDVTCVDNVILFPAIKRTGRPWVRIISCSENEVPDPDIPPHLSGCHATDKACFKAFEKAFLHHVRPTHARFNAFLEKIGEKPYPLGEFFETSPWMNLLLYPKPLQFERRHRLGPKRFQYLEGCVRDEGSYAVPDFPGRGHQKLIYVSYGSLGAADVDLYKRMIALFGKLPYRFLMNVGDYMDQYTEGPENVHLAAWFPQPSVIPHVDLFIHHGGNNSFNEALYFGKPALIMPFCWDGLDNAARIHDTGYGEELARYDWSDQQLVAAIERLLHDTAMHRRLAAVSSRMKAAKGADKAAEIIARVAASR